MKDQINQCITDLNFLTFSHFFELTFNEYKRKIFKGIK